MINMQLLQGMVILGANVLVVYFVYPKILKLWWGQLLVAVSIGAYYGYVQYKQMVNLQQELRYQPTGMYQEQFTQMIQKCGVQPEAVQLRYAYVGEQTALANGNCMIMDPLVWQGLNDDPQAAEVVGIFEKFIEPGLAPLQKQRVAALRKSLTPAAQRFVFRHELFHVVSKQSQRKILSTLMMVTTVVYAGTAVAMRLLPMSGWIALAAGIVVGGASDVTLTFIRNYFWQYKEETNADLFAVQHSTAQEIQEAAEFFKKHQEILDQNQESAVLQLPSELTTGHPRGEKRYKHLTALADSSRRF